MHEDVTSAFELCELFCIGVIYIAFPDGRTGVGTSVHFRRQRLLVGVLNMQN